MVRGEERRAFGVEAERRAGRIPGEIPVLVCDPQTALAAQPVAAAYRRHGRLFYVAPLVDDPRAQVAQAVSGQLLRVSSGIDARRGVFDLLAREQLTINNLPQTDVKLVDDRLMRTLHDIVVLSDAVLARSTVDAERIARICGYRRRFVVAAPGTDATVPAVVVRERTTIVVWAPRLHADRLGVIAMGLSTFRSPIVYVCAAGTLPDVPGTFVGPERGAEALATAACIVDASLEDPATAIALASLGVPVVAAATTGAAEFLDGVFGYEPWDARSLHAAVSRSRGGLAPVPARDPMPVERLSTTLARTVCPVAADGPPVSIVLATYNRRSLLPIALDSLAAQTYTNLDVVVVNDGGEDVTDICARYPFVRLVTMPQNGGYCAALQTAMQYVNGRYFMFWPDDDWMFPDHVARLVHALETTGASVSHTQTLTCYFLALPDGTWKVRAYKVLHERPNDPIETLTGPTMTFCNMLFRRTLLDEIGFLDPDLSLADFEYTLRASQRYDFIAVDAVTSQWNYNVEGKSFQHQMGLDRMAREQRAIYARYPSDLKYVADRRATWDAQVTSNGNTVLWPPDQYLPEDYEDDGRP